MAIPVYRLPPPQLELVSVTWAHPGLCQHLGDPAIGTRYLTEAP